MKFSVATVCWALASTALADWSVVFYDGQCAGTESAASGIGSTDCTSFPFAQESMKKNYMRGGCKILYFSDANCQQAAGDSGNGDNTLCFANRYPINSYVASCP